MIEPGSVLQQHDSTHRLFGYSMLHVEVGPDGQIDLAWPCECNATGRVGDGLAIVVANIGSYALVLLSDRLWWVEPAALMSERAASLAESTCPT